MQRKFKVDQSLQSVLMMLCRWTCYLKKKKKKKKNTSLKTYVANFHVHHFRVRKQVKLPWRRKTGLSPPVKYFTDRSKAVLLLWIFYVYVLSCVCYVFVRVCLYVLCGHLLGKG